MHNQQKKTLRLKILRIILVKLLFSVTYNNIYITLIPIISLSFVWCAFFKINTKQQQKQQNNKKIGFIEVITNTNQLNNTVALIYLLVLIVFFINVYLLNGKNTIVLFNHLNLNNYTVSVTTLVFIIAITTFLLLNSILQNRNDLIQPMDFIFAIINIIIITPHLLYTNTVFCFLFFLELTSLLLLYKLLSSKLWFIDKILKTYKMLVDKIPGNFISMLFFQYWVTFFSTIFIIYYYINIYSLYGSTEWYLVQYISLYMHNTNTHTILYTITFMFSVCFKLGVAPFHLFKLEVYKGLPYMSIFFYTTFYLLLFVYFFINLLCDLFWTFKWVYNVVLGLLTILGSAYTTALLFDVNLLKVFFAYSTIINMVGFFLILLSLF